MISGEWYIFDGVSQRGPMSRADVADFLKAGPNKGQVSVWRPGLEDWQPAEQLFDDISPPTRMVEVVAETSRKRRFSLYGLYGAAGLLLSDGVFEWRGNKFQPWSGNGTAENIGYIAGTTGLLVLICFIFGVFADGWANRKHRKSVLDPSTFDEPDVQPIVPLDPNRRQNFIAKFWRGEYSLGVSYWAFGLGGNIAVAVIGAVLVSILQPERGYDPRAILASFASVWALTMSFAVLQVVGVWRSSNRLITFRYSVGKKAGWATVAKILVVLGFLSSISTFLKTGLPQLVETSRMVFLDDPDMGAYSIRIMRNGTEAEITGGFKYGLTDDFSKVLKASRQIKIVHLDSLGGRVGEAIRLFGVLREQGVDTYVSNKCYSACTVAFAAGRNRFLRNGANLGFHAPAFPGMTKDQLESATIDQRRLFLKAGFNPSFIQKALSTPNDDLWKPSATILQQADVITGLSNGTDFAISGLGSDVTKSSVEAMLINLQPVYEVLKAKYPKTFDDIMSDYYNNYLAGKTEAALIRESGTKFQNLMSSVRPLADDNVLADLSILLADEYAALGAKSAVLCYQLASGTDAKSSYSSDLPKELTLREVELNRRALETARARTKASSAAVDEAFKKLGTQLLAKGISTDRMGLLSAPKINPSQYAEYCNVSTAFFREIGRMPARDSATIMRYVLTEK